MRITRDLRMRPSLASALALGSWAFLLCGVVAAIGAFQKAALWPLAGLSLSIAVGILSWVFSFDLEIKGGVLAYSRPFRHRITVRLADIEEAEFEVGLLRYRDRFRPHIRLVITPVKASMVGPFDINLAMFRRGDVAEVSALFKET